MLSIYIEGISDLRIHVAVTSLYLRDQDVTGWYHSLGSHILSTGKLMVKKFASGMHES